jgi:hypothetical protein
MHATAETEKRFPILIDKVSAVRTRRSVYKRTGVPIVDVLNF